MGMTAGVTLALTIYALNTKSDITYAGGALCTASIGLMLFGIFSGIFYS